MMRARYGSTNYNGGLKVTELYRAQLQSSTGYQSKLGSTLLESDDIDALDTIVASELQI